MGPKESERSASRVEMQWDNMPAGLCEAKGNRDFWFDTGHEVKPGESNEELEQKQARRLRFGVVLRKFVVRSFGSHRRLFQQPVMGPATRLPNRVDCHNSYLLWASHIA